MDSLHRKLADSTCDINKICDMFENCLSEVVVDLNDSSGVQWRNN